VIESRAELSAGAVLALKEIYSAIALCAERANALVISDRSISLRKKRQRERETSAA
jgi:hypothetical protein